MEPCIDCGAIHERQGHPTCSAHRRSDGHFCKRFPLNGSRVCVRHGAAAPQVRALAAQRYGMTRAQEACDRLGVQVDIDPGEALIEMVREAAGNVEFYRTLVAELAIHPEDDDRQLDDSGDPYWVRGETGVYGLTYHQSGIPTGEAKPHILVVLYNEERDKLVRYSKEALAAGVEERRLRLAEADARQFYEGMGEAMSAAELTPEQIEVFRSVLAQSLRLTAVPVGRPAGSSAQPVPV